MYLFTNPTFTFIVLFIIIAENETQRSQKPCNDTCDYFEKKVPYMSCYSYSSSSTCKKYHEVIYRKHYDNTYIYDMQCKFHAFFYYRLHIREKYIKYLTTFR